MLRRLFPRLHLLRANAPILPTAARLAARPRLPTSLSSAPAPAPAPAPTPAHTLSLVRHFRTSTPRLASPSRPGEHTSALPPNATVSQRLKHLVKSYGWYALGVYIVLSALDFSVAFVGINLLGAEQVSQAAAYVKQVAFGFLYNRPPEPGRDEIERSAVGGGGHEGLYAMLVLAYTIHKTVFLPVRVGLTAALTPRIVGWLRARGWAGSEGAKRAARETMDKARARDHD